MRKITLSWTFITIFFIQGVCQSIQFTGHIIHQASSRIFFAAASDLDQDGDQDIMFAGAAEAPITPITFGSFDVVNVLSVRND